MWKPIEIKPGDQSLIGKAIRQKQWPDSHCIVVLCVGDIQIFGRDDFGQEFTWQIINSWLEWIEDEPVKETKLVSRAIVTDSADTVCQSYGYFSNLEAAKKSCGEDFVQWPARVVLKNVTWKSSNDLSAYLFFEVQHEVKNERN